MSRPSRTRRDGRAESSRREDLPLDQSVLSQRKDPDQYPEVTYLGTQYARFRLFREWNLGRNTAPRKPQATDLSSPSFAGGCRKPCPSPQRSGAPLQPPAKPIESSEMPTSLLRTFRQRCSAGRSSSSFTMQACGHPFRRRACPMNNSLPLPTCMLCHPAPPPLVCLEEPDLGLHPDVFPGPRTFHRRIASYATDRDHAFRRACRRFDERARDSCRM